MRWRPDTCECYVEFDGGNEEVTKNALHKCEVHKKVKDSDLMVTLLEENRRKNYTFSEIQAEEPEIEEKNYYWKFDKDRNLEVMVVGKEISDSVKSNLKSWLSNRFGRGKVKLN